MIYLVDMTCYSHELVSKLKKRLGAKIYDHRVDLLRFILCTYCMFPHAHDIWLYVWDDSPFSGEYFDRIMKMEQIHKDNWFFVHLDKYACTQMDQYYNKIIEQKLGRYKDYVYVISPDDQQRLDELCDMILRLERNQ